MPHSDSKEEEPQRAWLPELEAEINDEREKKMRE